MSGTSTDELRRVNALLQAGNYREAHTALQAIVDADPRGVEALRLLAGTKLALGDAAAAEALLRRALQLDPGWTPTLATLGELLLASGRADEAEALLRRAAGGPAPLPHAARLLARRYNETGRPGEALAVAAPLCDVGMVDPELAAQHIAALAALGRHEQAVSHYRRLAEAVPGRSAAAHALAIALNAANRHAEAERVAQAAIAGGHRSAALYNTYARSLIARGDHERAEAALRDGLRLDPRLVDAQSTLAQLVWVRTGSLTESTATLDRALESLPNDDALWAAKAAILQGAGDARGAYACLADRAARAQAPPMLLVRAALAALEFAPSTALDLAGRALRAVPGHPVARTLQVAANLGIGDARTALTQCEALLTATPDDQYLIALQTTAWRLLGDERYATYCDYRELVLPLELEPPPPWPDLASFLADLKTSLNRLHDPHGHPLLFQSLRNGTETTQDLSRNQDPVIQALFRSFAAPIGRYLERMGRGADALRRRNAGSWRFNGSWSVRLRSAGYHANHVHPRGWISSACYIDLPRNMRDGTTDEGILTFGEPSIMTVPKLAAEYSVRPRIGMLVLFPSYVWHGTVPFRSDEPRLTVAFDVVPDR